MRKKTAHLAAICDDCPVVASAGHLTHAIRQLLDEIETEPGHSDLHQRTIRAARAAIRRAKGGRA